MAHNSKVILAKNVPFIKDYTIVTKQAVSSTLTMLRGSSYFVGEKNNFSMINNTENKIRVDFTYEQCINSNYIAFQNPSYNNQWFFAWIDSVTLKSEKSIELTFTVDIWTLVLLKGNIVLMIQSV